VNCAERGVLLLRVRDEIRMTTNAYQTLYESAIAWGMRKALESEQGKADMEKKVSNVTLFSHFFLRSRPSKMTKENWKDKFRN
jgi:hypothetical protein